MSAPTMITSDLVKQWQREMDRLSNRHPHGFYVNHHPSGCATVEDSRGQRITTVEDSRGQRITTVETSDEWVMFYTGLSNGLGEAEDALTDYSDEASPRD